MGKAAPHALKDYKLQRDKQKANFELENTREAAKMSPPWPWQKRDVTPAGVEATGDAASSASHGKSRWW